MQERKIEEAIWVAVRALQEKEKLAEQRAWQMIAEGDAGAARGTLVRKAFIVSRGQKSGAGRRQATEDGTAC